MNTKHRISKSSSIQVRRLSMEISSIKSQIKIDRFLLINKVRTVEVSILRTNNCHLKDTLMMKIWRIRTLLIFQLTVIQLHSASQIRISTHSIMISLKAVINCHSVKFHRENLKLTCKHSLVSTRIASTG